MSSAAPSTDGEDPPLTRSTEATREASGPSRRRLLLVEDNPGDVALITAVLARPSGGPRLDVSVAGRLATALEELPGGIALVLLDLRLPDGDGVDVLRRIRGQAPDVPVVVLTGMEDAALARQCLEEGAQDYVRKDELPDHDLRRAIDFALARVRARELAKRLEHSDRLAAIGRLAAGVAHEVNNPAAFVQANSHEIARALQQCHAALAGIEHVPPEVLTTLENVRAMARDNLDGMDRIVSIVRGLTVFARAQTASSAPLDVGELCRTSSNLVLHQLRLRARFELDLVPTPPVVADSGTLGQVLVNLLINAAQAIEPGNVGANRVTLRTRAEEGSVVISVIDTGHGITPGHANRIFEPFFSTKPEGEGTGLGLSISREIVENHGGTLTVESSRELGTCFEIRLPASSQAVSPSATGPQRAEVPRVRRRVLLVDDEPQLLSALRRALERHHTVVTAPGGAEALAILRDDEAFDVVVCDLVMPEVDGIATFEAIDRDFPDLVGKLVILSGGAPTPGATRLLHDRGVELLRKPVTVRALLDTIDRLAEGQQP